MKKEDKVLIIAGIVVIAVILIVLLMLPEDLAGKPTAVLSNNAASAHGTCLEATPFPDPISLSGQGSYTFTFQSKEAVQITSNPSGNVQMLSDHVFRVLNIVSGQSITFSCASGTERYTFGFA